MSTKIPTATSPTRLYTADQLREAAGLGRRAIRGLERNYGLKPERLLRGRRGRPVAIYAALRVAEALERQVLERWSARTVTAWYSLKELDGIRQPDPGPTSPREAELAEIGRSLLSDDELSRIGKSMPRLVRT